MDNQMMIVPRRPMAFRAMNLQREDLQLVLPLLLSKLDQKPPAKRDVIKKT